MTEPTVSEKIARIKARFSKLTEDVNGPFVVTAAQQNKKIKELLPNVKEGHVIFVMDMLTFEISHVHGADKWLGYSDSNFGLYQYLQCLNTPMFKEFSFYSIGIMEECIKGRFKHIGFMKGSYNTCHSLRDSYGKDFYVQRSSRPFQFNEKKQITQYINIIKIVKPYDGESFYVETESLPEEYLLYLRAKAESLEQKTLFTEKQRRVIELCMRDKYISNSALAEKLNVSEGAIKKTKQRIKARVKKEYGITFPFFHQLIDYLKKNSTHYPVQKGDN